MSRLEKLFNVSCDPSMKKIIGRLTSAELNQVAQFVKEHKDLSDEDYILKISQWHINSEQKPKHLVDMWAIAVRAK